MAAVWSTQRRESGPLGRVEYRSPSLELLVERLESPGRNEILDLGPAIQTNVQFFSGVPCKLHIEDLGHSMVSRAGTPPPDEVPDAAAARLDALVEAAMCYGPQARFDIILGWDLFNYMAPQTIRALMTRVGRQCHQGTLLFLMVPTLEEMPAVPARVTMSEDRRMVYEPQTHATIECPRYTPLALERMMPRFRLFHSFLLGDGMQDYLFCYQ